MSARIVELNSISELADIRKRSEVVLTLLFAANSAATPAALEQLSEVAEQTKDNARFVCCKIEKRLCEGLPEEHKNSDEPLYMTWKRASRTPERDLALLASGRLPDLPMARLRTTDTTDAGSGPSGPSTDVLEATAEETKHQETWHGCPVPRGFIDLGRHIEMRDSEALNVDTNFGSIRDVLAPGPPGSQSDSTPQHDWIESDTDEQILFFIPLRTTSKVHSLQITSRKPGGDEGDNDAADGEGREPPSRPQTIKIFSNQPDNLGFDVASEMPPTQEVVLGADDWNSQDTANITLRLVKFQSVTSLVIFVVDGDGASEKVRVDRVRLVGKAGNHMESDKLVLMKKKKKE